MRLIETTRRALRMTLALIGVSVVSATAGAQTSAGSAASTMHGTALTAALHAAPAPQTEDTQFDLDDALLDGVQLTPEQHHDVAQLRRLQIEEQESARPRFLDAVAAMRRARDRGDDAAAAAIMAALQGEMQSQRTWRLAAVRALLTAEQRLAFDVNVDALLAGRKTP